MRLETKDAADFTGGAPGLAFEARLTFGDDDAHTLSFSYLETTSAERDVPYDTFLVTGGTFGNVDQDILSQTATLSYGFNPLGDDLIDAEVTLSYANQEIDQQYVEGSSTCAGGPPFPCGLPFPPGGFPTVNADLQFA